MKTTLANFLSQIISNFIRVRIFIFTRCGGQNIYFLCMIVRNPDKHYRERTDTLQNKHAFKVNAPSYILFFLYNILGNKLHGFPEMELILNEPPKTLHDLQV